MEDNAEKMSSDKKRGGRYCVAGAPQKTSCKNNSHTDGIAMHQFPKNPEVRRKWVKFVQRHRSDFDETCVSNYTSLCSAHFDESCYTHSPSLQIEGMAKMKKFLTRGSIPTRDSVAPVESNTLTERRKRQVSKTYHESDEVRFSIVSKLTLYVQYYSVDLHPVFVAASFIAL